MGAGHSDGEVILSGDFILGENDAAKAVYLASGRVLSISPAGLALTTKIFLEDVAETEKSGRVVAIKQEGGKATSQEQACFSYLPGVYGVAAQAQTSNYILSVPALSATPLSLSFEKTIVGKTSAVQEVKIEGIALSEDISFIVPDGFKAEKAADWDSRLGGTLLMSFAPGKAGSIQGVLEVSSSGLTESVSLQGEAAIQADDSKNKNIAATGDSTVVMAGGFTVIALISLVALALIRRRMKAI